MIDSTRHYSLHLLQKMGLIALFCSITAIAFSQNCTTTTGIAKENAWSTLSTPFNFGGSTFTACATGSVTTLTFKVTDTSHVQPKALLFFEKGIGDGVIEWQSVADYVQEITIPGNGSTVKIELNTPFPVSKGEVYTWYIQKDPNAGTLIQSASIEPNNTYTEGETWFNNEVYPSVDNLFSVAITK